MRGAKLKRKKNFWLRVLILSPLVWCVAAWAMAQILIVEKPLAKADAILVLGGSSTYKERTDKAAELFRQGAAAKIFLTDDGELGGWSPKDERNPHFWELAKRRLIAQTVPENAIEVLPGIVDGTRDEALLLVKTAQQRGDLHSILLVTSGYHTRRALWTFERAAAENNVPIEFGVESAPIGRQTSSPYFWWLAPRGWRDVAGEYLKFVYYWLFY